MDIIEAIEMGLEWCEMFDPELSICEKYDKKDFGEYNNEDLCEVLGEVIECIKECVGGDDSPTLDYLNKVHEEIYE